MENKKGTIKTVTSTNGATGTRLWTRYEFEMIDGKKYSTFDKDLSDKYGAGMSVIMSGHQEGQYWKLDNMIIDTQDDITVAPIVVKIPEITPNILLDARSEVIVAQVILKEASAMVQTHMTDEYGPESIGKCLCDYVNELTGAFKLALSNIKAL